MNDPLRHREGQYVDPASVVETVCKYWNDRLAAYEYAYIIHHEWINGDRERIRSTSGDEEWIQRMLDHYKIAIPDEENTPWRRTTPYAQ